MLIPYFDHQSYREAFQKIDGKYIPDVERELLAVKLTGKCVNLTDKRNHIIFVL